MRGAYSGMCSTPLLEALADSFLLGTFVLEVWWHVLCSASFSIESMESVVMQIVAGKTLHDETFLRENQ